MPRRLLLAVLALLALPVALASAHLDHPVPTISGPLPPVSTEFNAGGEDAEWDLLHTIPTLNSNSDLDFFKQGQTTYASVGSLGIGANGGGQQIVQLTDGSGNVDGFTPKVVGNHPSAACPADPTASLGLQHDVEATPKGSAFQNTQIPQQNTSDTQLLLDASDAGGRCHDQGAIVDSPLGGLEIIDVTDVTQPKEIGLTSHIGEAHTVNVDPRRPHIAYVVTSDSVGVDADGKRANEEPGGAGLDGFEVVDLRSCMEAPLGTLAPDATLQQKRDQCRPEVFRYRYPSIDIAIGHTNRGDVYGCHELEVYPDDRLTCGSGAAAILFDISGMFDDNGTPADFTDDRIKGTPLPCSVRDSSTTVPLFGTGAKVTDCVTGTNGVDLRVAGWQAAGSPSVTGIQHLGSAFHMGREDAQGALQPAFAATQDIDFDHEVEFTDSRRFLLATDERGGGVTGGAQCTQGTDLDFANGGIHAYAVDRLQAKSPTGPDAAEQAFGAYARTSQGDKAIFRVPVQTPLQASFCTAHVFQQIPGENRIFMGWYSQGTQVVDYTENADGTIDFKRAGFFIPEGANTWVSAVFKVERNADGTSTYYGATGDGVVANAGRSAVDVYKVTLPSAPGPANRVGGPAPPSTPGLPPAPDPGTALPGGNDSGNEPPPPAACVAATTFRRATVRPRGAALRVTARRRAGTRPATFVLRQTSRGSRVVSRRVARVRRSGASFRVRGRALPDGTYEAILRSGRDVRRFSLLRRDGRFKRLPASARRPTCGLIRSARLTSNAFGRRGLGIRIAVGEAAQVRAVVRRAGKVVRRFRARTVQPGTTARLRFKARRAGAYRVQLAARRESRRATVTLTARRP